MTGGELRTDGVDPQHGAPAAPGVRHGSTSRLALASGLGWQIGQLAALLAPDRTSVGNGPAGPATADGAEEIERLLVRTVAHRIRRLELLTTQPPNLAPAAIDALRARPTGEQRLRALCSLHEQLLEVLAARDATEHDAYEVGHLLGSLARLADPAGAPPVEFRRAFSPESLLASAALLARLEGVLAPHSAYAIFRSLERWSHYVAAAADADLATAPAALREQSRIWRDLLLHEVEPASLRPLAHGPPQHPPHPPATTGSDALATTSLHAAFRHPGTGGAALVDEQIARAATRLPVPAVAEAPGAKVPGIARPAHRRLSRVVLEWVALLAAAAGAALVIEHFAIQSFYVPSTSMVPTILPGDRILADKLPFVRDAIHRGDVVVFRAVAADRSVPPGTDLVKRVVGLPGETIAATGGAIRIDGRRLAQSWLPRLAGACAVSGYTIPRQVIPAHHYFVMGDCRGLSVDSRVWGTVARSDIVGKAFVVLWRHDHPWFSWL